MGSAAQDVAGAGAGSRIVLACAGGASVTGTAADLGERSRPGQGHPLVRGGCRLFAGAAGEGEALARQSMAYLMRSSRAGSRSLIRVWSRAASRAPVGCAAVSDEVEY
jgi:hypothetical protein